MDSITTPKGETFTVGQAVTVKGSTIPREIMTITAEGKVRLERTDGKIVACSVWTSPAKLVAA